MASRDFRVHVIKANGTQGIEIRTIGNTPTDLPDDELIKFAERTFAHFYGGIGEKYGSIELVGADEDVAPRPGQFPAGFDRSVHQE